MVATRRRRALAILSAPRTAEGTMNQLSLTPEQYGHVVHCCRRVLLNLTTSPLDLKRYLVTRLNDSHPEAAALIEHLDTRQMGRLLEQILASLHAGAEAHLWN